MLYSGYIQAIKHNVTYTATYTTSRAVFASSYHEAIGFLMEHCREVFSVGEGYNNHSVGCFELSKEELQRGLDEITQKGKN